MKLSLRTDEGLPIYVKDFRMYWRYEGPGNASAQICYSDYSVVGSDIFSISPSKTIFVSDTDASVGISIVGFSYTADMWDFMVRNWQHWYEYPGDSSTDFSIEGTADLQYLLAWEFQGVDDSVSTDLRPLKGQYSTYETKYDIPGPIGKVWANSGTDLSMGGDATFYMRRSTDTSLNPFFSGMTRKTFVQGVFCERYFPTDLLNGFFERTSYISDYSHVSEVGSGTGIFLPDKNFLTPVPSASVLERIGLGPYYPSLRTFNMNDTFVFIHPLLSDQAGSRVGSMSTPNLNLFRNGYLVSSYQLAESRTATVPERIIHLPGAGIYNATFDVTPTPGICSKVRITLGFTVPAMDVNPPRITKLSMPQRFVSGQVLPLELSVVDDGSIADLEISWHARNTTVWNQLAVRDLGSGLYAASIQTSVSDVAVDIKVRVADSAGNYLEYTATDASMRQIPVLFDLAANPKIVQYSSENASVLLAGRLTDINGNPLSQLGAVPIELKIGDKKVAMILDEFISPGTHSHNGSIQFDWHFNPSRVFPGPGQSVNISAKFDLGIYEPITRTITLQSQKLTNDPPIIRLLSPSNGSLISAGQLIDLNVEDDGPFAVNAYLDGSSIGTLQSPWDIVTSAWSDGNRVLRIVATDDRNLVTTVSYVFEVDALAPSVAIAYPIDGGRVPLGAVLAATIVDKRLTDVYYSLDGGPAKPLSQPYRIDMTSWPVGIHDVVITAIDAVGHISSESVSFEIVDGSIAIQLENPRNGGAVRSGVPLVFSVAGSGAITSRWCEASAWNELGDLKTIPTNGWSEGVHDVVVNSTSDLGGFDQYSFTVIIDDTPPMILLSSPSNNSFVSPSDSVMLQVLDANMLGANWTVWDRSGSTTRSDVVLSLTSPPLDGDFEVNVVAVDKAGNEARASFAFAMDSSPPVVSFEDWSSGDAIRPGHQLNFTATDAFLSMVQCAIDGNDLTEVKSPFAVNTSSLSGGIHQLTVIASDLSGKKTTANISFYVDAVAPNALITSSSRVTLNASCTVTASVSDDYSVAIVQLFYELQGGGFGSVMMAGYDGVYVAELAPDLLWRGMTIYVLATDKVGNVAESPRMILLPATSPFDGNLPLSGSPSGWGAATWAWIVSINGLAVLGSIGVLALAGVALYVRSRREDEPTERAVKPKPSPRGVSTASPFAELPPPKPIIAVSAKQIVDSVKAAAKTVGQVQVPTRVPTATATGIGATTRVRLLDSIPEIALKPDIRSPEDDIDYGELIERELNTSAWKNSVFGKGIGHSAVSREFDPRPDRPGIISGLKLKQILE